MDNIKTFLIFGLLIVSLLLWDAWQKDYVVPQQQAAEAISETNEIVQTAQENKNELPDLPATVSARPKFTINDGITSSDGQRVHITTDVLDLYLDTQGGDIRKLALLSFPQEAKEADVPVQLLDDTASLFYVAQSGLRSEAKAPTHYDRYIAENMRYQLIDGQDVLVVPLHWQSDNGLKVTKTYRFKRDSYLVDISYLVENNTGENFSAYPYAQFNRTRPDESSGFIRTYTGAVFSTEENNYEKVDFDDLDDASFNQSSDTGWTAMLQHYFLAAWIPDQDGQEKGFYGKSIDERNYTAGVRMPVLQVAPGDMVESNFSVYLGPKAHKRLEQAAENLDLTVDFGMLTIISQPLFTVMEWIHKLTNNWGWSIVILTVLIKLAFFRLSARSYRSMAAMRKLTPKLTSLKERYGDDKQKFNKAMMDLYKTEKINPLGGCLPILVQMPVFLGFYWVLVESIELRQAPFIFWLQDLTAMDPYFVLPVVFGLSMWFQQRLNPAPQDPAQAMVMKAFPIVFTVFFAFFPSGLVLYWVVNNILSIAQQWYITHKMGAI